MKLKKVTIRLPDTHIDKLKKFYPSKGYNEIIRLLVDRHIRVVEARIQTKMEKRYGTDNSAE